jgi:hypothetical protein
MVRFFECPQLLGKFAVQAVKASSLAKAEFSGEMVASGRSFSDVLCRVLKRPGFTRLIYPAGLPG